MLDSRSSLSSLLTSEFIWTGASSTFWPAATPLDEEVEESESGRSNESRPWHSDLISSSVLVSSTSCKMGPTASKTSSSPSKSDADVESTSRDVNLLMIP